MREEYDFDLKSRTITPLALNSVRISDHWSPRGHQIEVNTKIKGQQGCKGRYLVQRCLIKPAVVNYQLAVTGNTTRYQRGQPLYQPYVPAAVYHFSFRLTNIAISQSSLRLTAFVPFLPAERRLRSQPAGFRPRCS